jgi:DNA-directed RNA polymerase specialized sigma subunit
MQGPNLERWQELCHQAATEQDPKRLMELTAEIIRLLDEKEKRLLAKRKQDDLNNSEPTESCCLGS